MLSPSEGRHWCWAAEWKPGCSSDASLAGGRWAGERRKLRKGSAGPSTCSWPAGDAQGGWLCKSRFATVRQSIEVLQQPVADPTARSPKLGHQGALVLTTNPSNPPWNPVCRHDVHSPVWAACTTLRSRWAGPSGRTHRIRHCRAQRAYRQHRPAATHVDTGHASHIWHHAVCHCSCTRACCGWVALGIEAVSRAAWHPGEKVCPR